MAFQLSYRTGTYRPNDELITGNSTSPTPVEFDLAPAEGTDLARIKSVIVSTAGISADGWSSAVQDAVIRAFETSAAAFVNTITAVRGLTIPVAMAARVGIPVPEGANEVPIVSGLGFTRICLFPEMLPLSMMLAAEILKLTNSLTVDPRLFVQPSGLQQPATANQGADSNATPARGTRDGSGTAGSPARRARRKPGTFRSNP